jgi:hypothetical protein
MNWQPCIEIKGFFFPVKQKIGLQFYQSIHSEKIHIRKAFTRNTAIDAAAPFLDIQNNYSIQIILILLE